MINAKLIEMRKTVSSELDHIPKGNIYQNMLRQFYFALRMSSLGKKGKYPNDKNEILKLSVHAVKEWAKKEGINFIPVFDEPFFKLKD